jgi:hypothetical protein
MRVSRKWLTIGAMLTASTSAWAEPPQAYDFHLSAAMTQAITKMLMTAPMPWQESNPILQEMLKQVQDQQKAPAAPGSSTETK